jgi:hypothetical protein
VLPAVGVGLFAPFRSAVAKNGLVLPVPRPEEATTCFAPR